MLQQTRVDTVIGYYLRFMERFPDVRCLAAAELETVLKQWEGLGYYARARNLHKAAQKIVDTHQALVPRDKTSMLQLPGVGDYIAAAVLSIAYGVPLAVVDGNVKRVLARVGQIEMPVNDAGSMPTFVDLAEGLLERRDPGSFNQAMMELGALICVPASPICVSCPVTNFCVAKQNGFENEYPKTKPRPKVPTHNIAVGVVNRGGKLLITKRAETGLLGGLWEFPGGKLKTDESPEDACARELLEEVGLAVTVREKIAVVHHAYTHFKIILHVFRCEVRQGTVTLQGPVDFKWVRPEALAQFPFPKANLKFMHLLV